MGRLKKRIHYRHGTKRRQLALIVRRWALPFLFGLVLIFSLHSTVGANPNPSASELAQYLQANELNVYTKTKDGYQQVFYLYNGREVTLSQDSYNHASVTSSGPNVVWEGFVGGGRQIFLYNVLTQTTLQLTGSGTNKLPQVEGDLVTWQTWDDQNWQVMYYNGLFVQQLTSGSTSHFNAATDGERIAYVEQVGPDQVIAKLYTIATGQTSPIREGDIATTAFPNFRGNGSITTAYQSAGAP